MKVIIARNNGQVQHVLLSNQELETLHRIVSGAPVSPERRKQLAAELDPTYTEYVELGMYEPVQIQDNYPQWGRVIGRFSCRAIQEGYVVEIDHTHERLLFDVSQLRPKGAWR